MSDGRARIDMSPQAIAERIAEVAALNRLCESLSQAKPIRPQAPQSIGGAPRPT